MEGNNTFRKIAVISRLFKQQARKEADNVGLNSTYFSIVPHLANNTNLTQSDLVQITRLKAPTISLTIKNMIQLGYVEKNNSKNDQRQSLLHLTEKGYELDKQLKKIFRDLENKIFDCLTLEEIKTLNSILEKIKTTFERTDK